MTQFTKTLTAGALVLTLAACASPTAAPTDLPPVEETVIALPTEVPTAVPAPVTSGNAAPAVQIVALQEGTTFVQGLEVGVAVLAADSDGIKSAGLVIDGEVVSTIEGTTDQIFQGTLTWTPELPGQFMAAVIVYDNSGGVADFAARQVIVLPAGSAAPVATEAPAGDTTPPAISIEALENPVTAGGDVDIAVNAVDDTGVIQLEMYVDGEVQVTWDYDPAAGAAPQSAFQTLTWRGAGAGDYEIYVTATDGAGNVGQSETIEVEVTP